MYKRLRDLHLYLGLFVSPFVLLFAASVFFLNHGKILGTATASGSCTNLPIPAGILDAQGLEAVRRVRPILDRCAVRGEVGFIRTLRKEQRLVMPVTRPGVETTVTIDVASRSAAMARRTMSLWETIGYLHKMPGPHLVAIRGNWFWTRAWRWFADATVYLLLFISASGVYLWVAIRAERRVGLALLAAGAVALFGTVYGILR